MARDFDQRRREAWQRRQDRRQESPRDSLPNPEPSDSSIEADESSINTTPEINFEDRAVTRSVSCPPGYWKMRNGRFIALTDMEDSHLTNCINMIENLARTRGRSTGSSPKYRELINERERRRLAHERTARVIEANRAMQQRILQRQLEEQQRNVAAAQSEHRLFGGNRPPVGNPGQIVPLNPPQYITMRPTLEMCSAFDLPFDTAVLYVNLETGEVISEFGVISYLRATRDGGTVRIIDTRNAPQETPRVGRIIDTRNAPQETPRVGRRIKS